MKDKFLTILSIALSLALVGLVMISVCAAEDVPRISKEELKELLGDPNVIILDIRQSENWQKSEFKIKGAIRRRPEIFDSWANEFPRDKVLFLYCA
jgi:rhodanese-related sulfurtransferase